MLSPYEDEKFCFLAASREEVSPCAARVLRHPRIDSGRITLKLCTPGGAEERMVTKKKSPQFKAARENPTQATASDHRDNEILRHTA